jgi:hypothetical protein
MVAVSGSQCTSQLLRPHAANLSLETCDVNACHCSAQRDPPVDEINRLPSIEQIALADSGTAPMPMLQDLLNAFKAGVHFRHQTYAL